MIQRTPRARAGNGSTPPNTGPRTPQPQMDVDSISPTAPFLPSTLRPTTTAALLNAAAYGPVAPHAVDHRGNPMAPPPALRGEAEAYAIGGAEAYPIGGAGAHARVPHVPPTLRTVHDEALQFAADTLPGKADVTPEYHDLRARMMQLEHNDFEMKRNMQHYVSEREQGFKDIVLQHEHEVREINLVEMARQKAALLAEMAREQSLADQKVQRVSFRLDAQSRQSVEDKNILEQQAYLALQASNETAMLHQQNIMMQATQAVQKVEDQAATLLAQKELEIKQEADVLFFAATAVLRRSKRKTKARC